MQTRTFRTQKYQYATKAYEPTPAALFDAPELSGVVIPFTKGAEIYGEGEPVDYVYKVVTGSVRTYAVLHDGRRHIGAFYLPGDIFGVETGAEHRLSAEAIADSTVMMVRRSVVMNAAKQDNGVLAQLFECTAIELSRARDHVQLLVKSAQERVASFLLEMAERLSGETVELPMSRQDIADYLGLTIETVSRTLTQLGHTKAIELPTSRRIVLRNRSALALMNS
jgi:CRP/FNR family nitrogen fixation transcriptional regulator